MFHMWTRRRCHARTDTPARTACTVRTASTLATSVWLRNLILRL
nr:MAG TPA: hypothetical protein [Caudoviricetes sp.]